MKHVVLVFTSSEGEEMIKKYFFFIFKPKDMKNYSNTHSLSDAFIYGIICYAVYALIMSIPYILSFFLNTNVNISSFFKVLSLKLYILHIFLFPMNILLSIFYFIIICVFFKIKIDKIFIIKNVLFISPNIVTIFVPIFGSVIWTIHSIYSYYLFYKRFNIEKKEYLMVPILWCVVPIMLLLQLLIFRKMFIL
jgi:hypothetical protein